MLRHVALFKWKEGVSDSDRKAVAEGLGALPAVIPEIRRYEFGGNGPPGGPFYHRLAAKQQIGETF